MRRPPLARWNLVVCLAMLSACAAGPAPLMTPSPVSAVQSWAPGVAGSDAATSRAGNRGVEAFDLAWDQYFTDPALQDLIRQALQNNQDLRIAALNVELARAQATLRDADFWPTLSLGLTGSRQSTASGKLSSNYALGLQASAFELDVWGRLRGLTQAAAAQVLAADENRRAVQMSLVATVASVYVSVRVDDEMVRLAKDIESSRAASLRLMALRATHGASSALDVRAAESALESARAAVVQAERQRVADMHTLRLLVGVTSLAVVPASSSWVQQVGAVDLWAGLPAQVLMRRPDVRQAEASLAATQANVESARAALFPKIVLTGSGGTASSELTQLFKAGTWGWSVAPQVLQTLFDAGRNQANLSAAQMGRDVAWLQYDKAIQSAFREASDAIASHATWQQQLRSVQQQERAEQDRARLIRLRVDQGAASELEGLDAQRAAWSAQMQLIQAQAQFAQVRISLYKALGGGWAVQRP